MASPVARGSDLFGMLQQLGAIPAPSEPVTVTA
jgi:hypothetical protein